MAVEFFDGPLNVFAEEFVDGDSLYLSVIARSVLDSSFVLKTTVELPREWLGKKGRQPDWDKTIGQVAKNIVDAWRQSACNP